MSGARAELGGQVAMRFILIAHVDRPRASVALIFAAVENLLAAFIAPPGLAAFSHEEIDDHH